MGPREERRRVICTGGITPGTCLAEWKTCLDHIASRNIVDSTHTAVKFGPQKISESSMKLSEVEGSWSSQVNT